jgi:hypothetical protein
MSDTTINDKYIKYNLSEEEYYKCINCDFYSKYERSIRRHIIDNICQKKIVNNIISCEYCKKEFKYNNELTKHLNNKRKCYITNDHNIEKYIEKTEIKHIKELTDELELERKKNEDFEEKINRLNKLNKDNEERNLENNIFMTNFFAELLLEKEEKKKYKYKYELEYNILKSSLFTFPNKNSSTKENQIYLLMNIIEIDNVEKIFNKIKTHYQEYISFIINYYNKLNNQDDNKIYGKERITYLKHLKCKLKEILNIEI